MAGPWEKYGSAPAADDGPWAKYGGDAPKPAPEDRSKLQSLGEGALRGAAGIGNTLLAPVRGLANFSAPEETTLSTLVDGKKRRTGMLAPVAEYLDRIPESMKWLDQENASNPISYGAGKLGAEVAMTAPVGGVIGKVISKAAPLAGSAAPIVNKLAQATSSGGMKLGGPAAATALGRAGDMGLRMAGGAINGAATSGLVDPSSAGTGAVIGGGMPPALALAGKAGSAIGRGISTAAKNTLGMTTGVGAEPISQAFKAGKAGNKTFLDNLKGDVQLTDVLDSAKSGLQAMNAAKQAEYRSGMVPIKGDQSVLSLAGISNAVDDASKVATYKGQVKNESANAAVEKMRAVVDEWKALDPTQFHTPEGLDALKQKLGGILEGIPFNEKSARMAAGKVYNATKSEIESQAPTYAKVMKGYQTASDQISEIERALSLGDRASKDTAMRKLQSLMRNNVQTNYGNRLSLANTLESQGGVELLPALSGQALNSWTPRSLSGQIGSGATALTALSNPLALGALPFQSPRLVGSLAYGAGRLSGVAQHGASGAQSGLSQSGLGGLLSDPDLLKQFLYRSAPVAAVDR